MIGEAVGRWMVKRYRHRHKRALARTAFDGVCPGCGGPMQFACNGETYGGSPQVKFVCHACQSHTWRAEVDPHDEFQYKLVRVEDQ